MAGYIRKILTLDSADLHLRSIPAIFQPYDLEQINEFLQVSIFYSYKMRKSTLSLHQLTADVRAFCRLISSTQVQRKVKTSVYSTPRKLFPQEILSTRI